MDTSEMYIKMCEKAFKDIGFLPDNGCPSQFATKDRMQWYGNALLLTSADSARTKTDDSITGEVYRQDQLQAMRRANTAEHALTELCELYKFIMDNSEYLLSKSREQVELAALMFQKYSKIWNGEDWSVIDG